MSTYNSPVDVVAATLVRSSSTNDLDAAVGNAFALLPDETLLKQGKVMYAVDTGTANTYLVALPVSPVSYADGLALTFKAVNANTGACTINVNTLGVVSIAREDGTALVTGDIAAGQMCTIRYSTTSGKFQLEGTNASSSATSAAASASASASSESAAAASASASASSESAAASSAGAASTSANTASTQATNASNSATEAANYLTAGVSASSVLIGTGAKSFTATTGKAWGAGQFLSLSSAANTANYMHGTVTSYDSGTGALVMNILDIGGSGTLADWGIAIAGSQGPIGATGPVGSGITPQAVGFTVTGGTTPKTLTVSDDLDTAQAARRNTANTFTAAQELPTGAAIASASTVNLDAATGNRVHITGTTAITAVTLTRGPRTVIFDGILTLTHHATNNNLPSAANITTAAGDRAIYESDGTTVYCVSYTKISGEAIVASPSAGSGGTTITGNVTLTVSSPASMVVTPTGQGLYATLPDATTLTKGISQFAIYNAGDYDYGVKDSAGTVLGWIPPRTGCYVGLADNATAAGTWNTVGLNKIGITTEYAHTTLANTGNYAKVIVIDADRDCILFGGTTLYAIVYNKTTRTWGSPTVVRSGIAQGYFLCVLSAANQILVVSFDTTTGMVTQTLSIPASAITVNAAVNTTLATNINLLGNLIPVGTSWVVGYSRATDGQFIRAITLAGTVPTVGNEPAVISLNVSVAPKLFASGSIVRVLCCEVGAMRVTPYTVTGVALALGTSVNTQANSNEEFRALLNGNGNIVCLYRYTGANETRATIFKLTGTTEAASTVTVATPEATYISTHCDLLVISASKTLLISATNTIVKFHILTDTAGTASLGTILSITASIDGVQGTLVSGTDALVSTYVSNIETRGFLINCSGVSPTLTKTFSVSFPASISMAQITPRDYYGNRKGNSMYSQNIALQLNNGNGMFDLEIASNYVRKLFPTNLGYQSGFAPVSNTTNVSYVLSLGSTSNASINIQRIEVAA